jgi:hypothetical protein
MKYLGYSGPLSQTVPPLVIGTIVQIINMPLVRATITIQVSMMILYIEI